MVHVKPRIDKKENRRCHFQTHILNVPGPVLQAYLENGLLPQASQGLRIALVHRGYLGFCVVGRLLQGLICIVVAVDRVKLERIPHL